MKELLTLTGQDAITLGLASHRQPEVLDGAHWRTVAALPEAQRACLVDPTTVRLCAPARVLVEDILKTSLQPGVDLNGTIALAQANTLQPLSPDQVAALAIIQQEYNR